MRTVVLAYHGNNVGSRDYVGNDHIALAEDLRLLRALGLPVVPLHSVVDALDGRAPLPPRSVALSFDDGSWFDWHDLPHPHHGVQRSLANVLRDAERPGEWLHATSFVIASPAARDVLDRTCLIGEGWWDDSWWPSAVSEGHLAIESHSWDHQHDTLPSIASGLPGGCFDNLSNDAHGEAEIVQASRYLDQRLPSRRTRLLAYPYGQSNDFLRRDYLPRCRAQHGLDAAFGCTPEPVLRDSDRWSLGRYVCGANWRSPDELRALLGDALRMPT